MFYYKMHFNGMYRQLEVFSRFKAIFILIIKTFPRCLSLVNKLIGQKQIDARAHFAQCTLFFEILHLYLRDAPFLTLLFETSNFFQTLKSTISGTKKNSQKVENTFKKRVKYRKMVYCPKPKVLPVLLRNPDKSLQDH